MTMPNPSRVLCLYKIGRSHLLPVVATVGIACQTANVERLGASGEWNEAHRAVLSSRVVQDHLAAFLQCEVGSTSVNAPTAWDVPAIRVTEAEDAVRRALQADTVGEGTDFSAFRRQIAGIERDGRRFIQIIGIGAVYFTDTSSIGVPAAVRREWRSLPILISHPGRNQFQAVYDVSARRVCALRFGNRA